MINYSIYNKIQQIYNHNILSKYRIKDYQGQNQQLNAKLTLIRINCLEVFLIKPHQNQSNHPKIANHQRYITSKH